MTEVSLSKSGSSEDLHIDREQEAQGNSCCDGTENEGNPKSKLLPIVTPAMATIKHNHDNNDSGLRLTSCPPPDGGYGWVIVVAASLSHMFIVGFSKSYSMFYVEIVSAYPNSSAYEVSWITVMLSTVGMLLSPLTAALCNKFSSRSVSMMGGLCAFTGIFLSSFATSVTQLVFTMGALTGFGMGTVTTSSILIISQYFNKKRSTACAICVAGNALGGFIMPPLLEYILHEYKLRGTLLIVSGLQLNILMLSYLYRPVQKYALVQASKSSVTDNVSLADPESPADTADSEKFNAVIPSRQSVDGHRQAMESSKHERGIGEELALYRAAVFMTNSAPNLTVLLQTSLKQSHSLCRHEFEVQCQKCKPSSIRRKGSTPSAKISVFFNSNKRNRSVSESTAFFNRPQQIAESEEQLRKILQRKDSHQENERRNSLAIYSVLNRMSTQPTVPLRTNMTNIKLNTEKCDCIGTNALFHQNSKGSFCNRDNNCQNNCTCSNDAYKSVSTIYAESDIAEDPESEPEVVLESSLQDTWKIIINFLSILGSCFDPEVLKTVPMILMCLSAALLSMAAPQGLFYVHAYFTSVGIDSSLVTMLLSITSLADLVGRLSTGFVADSGLVPVHWLYFICTGLAGVCLLCVPLAPSFVSTSALLSVYGFGTGSWVVLMPTILAINHGVEKLPASFGFVQMLMGIIAFIAPQISGAVIDSTGGYAEVYYMMGCCMAVAAVLQTWKNPARDGKPKLTCDPPDEHVNSV